MYLLAAVGLFFMIILIMVMDRKKSQNKAYIMMTHLTDPKAEEQVLEKLRSYEHKVRNKIARDGSTELTIQIDADESELSIADEIKKIAGVKDVTLIAYDGEYHG